MIPCESQEPYTFSQTFFLLIIVQCTQERKAKKKDLFIDKVVKFRKANLWQKFGFSEEIT